MALMLREMSTRYGQNPGGYIWAIVEPLGAILILSFAFSLLMRSPSLGSSFILFYATGYMPFSLYQSIALAVARSINFSKPLLFYPAVTWMDAILARLLLNTLTSVLVTYIVLSAILAVIDTRIVLDLRPMVEAMVLAMVLGMGIGTLNCALMGLFPTWDLVWSIVTRPLVIMSAILYIMEDLPRTVQNVLWYNPLVHITGIMRTGFYPMYAPQYVSPAYVLGVGLLCMMMGLILLGRYYRDIMNR